MKKEVSPYIAKLADQIQQLLAEFIERRIKDPRLGFVTITDVRVSPDGRQANIFYTELPNDNEGIDSQAALDSAKGLLRSTVAKTLGLKHVPTLTFMRDAMPEISKDMVDLLDRVKASDAQLAASAAAGAYAGDENPYKVAASVDPSEDGAS